MTDHSKQMFSRDSVLAQPISSLASAEREHRSEIRATADICVSLSTLCVSDKVARNRRIRYRQT